MGGSREEPLAAHADDTYLEGSFKACQLTVPSLLKMPPALQHGRAGHQRYRSIDGELVTLPPACASCKVSLHTFPKVYVAQ